MNVFSQGGYRVEADIGEGRERSRMNHIRQMEFARIIKRSAREQPSPAFMEQQIAYGRQPDEK